MPTCARITTSHGTACSRFVTTKPNMNKSYCWQHQLKNITTVPVKFVTPIYEEPIILTIDEDVAIQHVITPLKR